MKHRASLFTTIVMLFLFTAVSVSQSKERIDYTSNEYVWTVKSENSGDILIRGRKIDRIKHDIKKLIFALNKSEANPESFRTPANEEQDDPPKLKFKKIAGHTVSVEVINDQYLTQRMGSFGANAFLAAATYTLTEHRNINTVNFIFEDGDHAQPGRYARRDFTRNYKIRGVASGKPKK